MPKIKNIEDLTPLAKWKLLFIEDGIDCDDINFFDNLDKIKTKFKNRIPTVKDLEFFDSSKDEKMIPAEVYLEDEGATALVKFSYNPNSKFKLLAEHDKFFVINKKTKEEVDVSVSPVEKNLYSSLTFNGDFLEEFVQVLGKDRVGIFVYEGCWHWNIGKQCKFCDANPKRNWKSLPIPSVNSLKDFDFNVDKWWDSQKEKYLESMSYSLQKFLEVNYPKPHFHLALMAGNLPNLKSIWRTVNDVGEAINKVYKVSDCDSYLNVLAPPKEERIKFLENAHYKLGFRQIQTNLEVFGEKRFKEVCPGKAALAGYKNSFDSLVDAAKIFGNGKARSNFVLGAQPTSELLMGVKKLADKGVVSDYSVFIPKKCTPWENRKRPSVSSIVDFTFKLVDIYKKYDFKPIYCELSSRSNIVNEVFLGI